MRKEIFGKSVLLAGALAMGIWGGNLQEVQAAEDTVPYLLGEERVIYLDGRDTITVEGKKIVSVQYSSSKSKVAAISRSGVVKPLKKGKSVIRAKVTYRKKTGGKKYTKTLKYTVTVKGNSEEYFEYSKTNDRIIGLTNKGKNLKALYIPERHKTKVVAEVNCDAFEGNQVIEEVHMPEKLRTFSWNALDGCSNLKKVFVGADVTEISGMRGCSSLEEIKVDERNKKYEIRDGVLFCPEYKALVWYPAAKKDAQYEIPSGIKTVESNAFHSAGFLQKVAFPDSIRCISTEAFAGSGLTSIIVPDSIDDMGGAVFKGCSNLKEIQLSKNVEEIPYSTLQNCVSLTSVNLPASITYVGTSTFEGCTALDNIQAAEANRCYFSEDGVLYNKQDGKVVYYYPEGRKEETYKIMEGATGISYNAFLNASCKFVEIPDSLETIDYEAFENSRLQKISIPDSVTVIGEGAWKNCRKLEEIRLSDRITKLPDNMLENCIALTRLDIPAEISSFSRNVVMGCKNLRAISLSKDNTTFSVKDGVLYTKSGQTLIYYPQGKVADTFQVPENVKEIRENAFYAMNATRSIVLPDSLEEIGYGAFENAGSLVKVNWPEGLKTITSSAFRGCNQLTDVNISNSVQTIGDRSFYGCASLQKFSFKNVKEIGFDAFGKTGFTKLTLGGSISTIGMSAFCDCTKLKELVLGKNIKKIDEAAFRDCTALRKIKINSRKLTKKSLTGAHTFKEAGANAPGKLVVDVPNDKVRVYTGYLRKAGLTKKAKIK